MRVLSSQSMSGSMLPSAISEGSSPLAVPLLTLTGTSMSTTSSSSSLKVTFFAALATSFAVSLSSSMLSLYAYLDQSHESWATTPQRLVRMSPDARRVLAQANARDERAPAAMPIPIPIPIPIPMKTRSHALTLRVFVGALAPERQAGRQAGRQAASSKPSPRRSPGTPHGAPLVSVILRSRRIPQIFTNVNSFMNTYLQFYEFSGKEGE